MRVRLNDATGCDMYELRRKNCVPLVEQRSDVCEYCKSILVRTDLDLKKVGQVSISRRMFPRQIGTEGIYKRQSFVAIGRIIYEYNLGT